MTVMPTKGARHHGFTLIELLITMIVGIVIVSFAVPSLTGFVKTHKVMTVADSFNSAVSQARSIAAATNSYVTVAPVDGDWKNGWQVFNEHASPSGAFHVSEGDTLIAQYDNLPSDIAYTVNATNCANYVSFSPTGYSQNKDKAQMSLTIGFDITTAKRVVEVNLLGRARVCNPDRDGATCAMPARC